MANPEHVGIVERGKEAIAEWRKSHPQDKLDLSGANLPSLASLIRADLSGASLVAAKLSDIDLSGANLSRASLIGANLSRANLTGADLSGAFLIMANLAMANLARTNLAQAVITYTVFGDCDLSRCQGLGSVEHIGPSSIGVDTLSRTLRGSGGRFTKEQLTFFRRASVPRDLLKALPGIVREIKYYSCFIAYGAPDEEFARKLHKALQRKGVDSWFFPENAKVAERARDEERTARKNADKVIVVCSGAGLGQDGLKREIDEQSLEDASKFAPISLDDEWRRNPYKIEHDGRELKQYLKDNVWADFKKDGYRKALGKLLKGLERLQARRARRAKAS